LVAHPPWTLKLIQVSRNTWEIEIYVVNNPHLNLYPYFMQCAILIESLEGF
jgi:hypothetical protein